MVDQDNIWYRLGYALEQARERLPRAVRSRSLEEQQADLNVGAARMPRPGRGRPTRGSPTNKPWETVVALGVTTLLGRVLEAMPGKRKIGAVMLLRAGAAGLGAALLRELLHSLRSREGPTPPLARLVQDAAVNGVARGLVYGSLVEPRIPGPSLVRGAAYGSLEYAAAPWGGLANLVGARAPHRKVPFLADLLDDLGPDDDTLIDHVLFGIALATLYGAGPTIADHGAEDYEED